MHATFGRCDQRTAAKESTIQEARFRKARFAKIKSSKCDQGRCDPTQVRSNQSNIKDVAIKINAGVDRRCDQGACLEGAG